MKGGNSDYLIKILAFYKEKKNKLMVKYQYSNKRVVDIVTLEDFLDSPLIHVIHPLQLYYLGFDSSNFLSSNKKDPEIDDPNGSSKGGRFKRVFIHR